MAGPLRQRGGDPQRHGIDRAGVEQTRLSARQRASLVEHDRIDLRQPLQRSAVLEQDAAFEQSPRRDDLHHRNRQSEGARAGDDKDRDRDGDGAMRVPGRAEPAEKGQQGDAVDHRRVESRRRIRDPPMRRAAGLGRFHQAHHLGEEGIRGRRRRDDRQRPGQVERARLQGDAAVGGNRLAFAGHDRPVDAGAALDHGGVDGNAIAGGQQDRHARFDLVDRQIGAGVVRPHDQRPARGQPRQAPDRRPRAVAHHVIQNAPDQQKEQQRDRRVEIGMKPVLRRLVEAEAERQRHTDRDRNVHVGVAVAQRAPCGPEEDLTGIEQRRQRDQRRQPVEQIPCRAVGSRPDRHRKQHDVARGKSRDGKGADQRAKGRVLRVVRDVVEMRFVADRPQRLDDRRRIGGVAPEDGRALARKIDARGPDAGQCLERGLDALDAAAAMEGGDREHGLLHPGAHRPARQQDLGAGAGPAEADLAPRRTTTHIGYSGLTGLARRVPAASGSVAPRGRRAMSRVPPPETPR